MISSAPDTRRRILSEAARLFVERGYHGISMRELALAVGVTKPALYHHYADKEAVFLAIMEVSLASLEQMLVDAEAQSGIHAQLGTLVQALTESGTEQRMGLQLAPELKHISPERRHSFEQHYRRVWMGGLGRMLAQAAGRGEVRGDLPPTELVRAFMGLLYPLAMGAPLERPRETGEALLSVFFGGVTPQPERP
ncbi:TetR/AcrR family transcriptional regulator [Deinococcus lacus]|uniref:TetR/AcrR family transcriptional regulator n=1 Tax=Deinococcus lacus TaxID=392561 RepID=A0ABW1Y9H9_9DEIO